ncbi:hypothetical protein E3E12_03425 [Formicincola oecophyllae]|uniref:Secreted protein n=1 Tax=Formicincola oecophyllae TaxID=2558361 RepID=A0A4Y6U8T4_9PROT|nr:hypothetical protein [Formicincola oecophyllae]QDH13410.1 hypothetical protein E3E12_03425 [Formicincola oecophyllae]
MAKNNTAILALGAVGLFAALATVHAQAADSAPVAGPASYSATITDQTKNAVPMFLPTEVAVIPDATGAGFIRANRQKLYVKEAALRPTPKGEEVSLTPGQLNVTESALFHIGTGKNGDCPAGNVTAVINGDLLSLADVGTGKTVHQVPTMTSGSQVQTCLVPDAKGHASATVVTGPAGTQHTLLIQVDRVVPRFHDGRADLSAAMVNNVTYGGLPGFVLQMQAAQAQARAQAAQQAAGKAASKAPGKGASAHHGKGKH